MSTNKFLLAFYAVTSMIFFNGCGGGSSNNISQTTPVQPHSLSSQDFQRVDVLSQATSASGLTVTTDNNTITISRRGTYRHDESHYQIFINVDNDANTGFRFDNEAWDNAGTDYIVEDGHLFKSTANDASWSWDENVGAISYSEGPHLVSTTINKSLLQGLGDTIRIGFITRNLDWSVRHFYPRSSQMEEHIIDLPPTDTVAPVITLNGSKNMVVKTGSIFTDPGATAKDNVDGDITDKIDVQSNVNADQAGSYQIIYSVKDSAGNDASIKRSVKVVDEVSNNIIIDGNNSDWADIPVLTETDAGVLKAVDTADTLYLLYTATKPYLINTQFFLDVDNDASTGFQFNGDIWNQGGADYMIENNHLDKSKTNSSAWGWDYNVASIEFVKHLYTIEVAIPKNALSGLGDSVNIGFVRRSFDWQTEAVLAKSGMVNYLLTQTPHQTVERVLVETCKGSQYYWLSDGTVNNSHISRLSINEGKILEHNGYWYQGQMTSEGKAIIIKTNGVDTEEIVNITPPLELGGIPSISVLFFNGNRLYFKYKEQQGNDILNQQIWSTDDGLNTQIRNDFHGNDEQINVRVSGSYKYAIFFIKRRKPPELHRLEVSENGSLKFTSLGIKTYAITYQDKIYSKKGSGEQFYESDYYGTYFEKPVNIIPEMVDKNDFYYSKKIGTNYELWVKNQNFDRKLASFELYRPNILSKVISRGAIYVQDSIGSKSVYRVKNYQLIKIAEQLPLTDRTNFNYVNGKDYFFESAWHSPAWKLQTVSLNTQSIKTILSEAQRINGWFRYSGGKLFYQMNNDFGVLDTTTETLKKLGSCN
jgi:hypothetical protein